MNDRPTVQDLLEVQDIFDLPSPALVEKDWFVMKALSAISKAETRPFQLVFSGGTALSRAHRLIRRMSEDIDLKIISKAAPSRPALRQLRDTITRALLDAGFQFDPENPENRESGNASRYTLFRLPYQPIARGEGSLRPEIQVEMAVWPLRLHPVELQLISFLAEASKQPAEVTAITCASISEIVAEKFVALTRRAGAELAEAGGPRDATLVRHIYDLHVVRKHYKPSEVIDLAKEIMLGDVKAYGHQFPAYRDDPIAETIRAVSGLGSERYAKSYGVFLRDMVYSDERPSYDASMKNLIELTAYLRKRSP